MRRAFCPPARFEGTALSYQESLVGLLSMSWVFAGCSD